MGKLRVGLFQMDLCWENPTDNILKIEKALEKCSEQIDLLVLPEMFTTGFSMEASHLALTYDHPDFIAIQNLSIKHQCSVIGSVWFKESDQHYNRCFHWDSNGSYEFYDKVHTFTLVNEHKHLSRGNTQTIFTVRNWKIKPQICYDLRFPKESYNQWDKPYDLLVYVANWPEKRIEAWDILLQARAVENQSFVIGVNRVGTEPKHINYVGRSQLISYTGEKIGRIEDKKEGILVKILDKTPQLTFRNRFPFIKDEI